MTPFSQLPLADKLKQAQRGDIVVTDNGSRAMVARPMAHGDNCIRVILSKDIVDALYISPINITDIIRPSEAQTAPTISQAMMDVVDRLGAEYDQVDPRCWDHMLIYAPKDIIRPNEHVRKVPEIVGKLRELMDKMDSVSLTDTQRRENLLGAAILEIADHFEGEPK